MLLPTFAIALPETRARSTLSNDLSCLCYASARALCGAASATVTSGRPLVANQFNISRSSFYKALLVVSRTFNLLNCASREIVGRSFNDMLIHHTTAIAVGRIKITIQFSWGRSGHASFRYQASEWICCLMHHRPFYFYQSLHWTIVVNPPRHEILCPRPLSFMSLT